MNSARITGALNMALVVGAFTAIGISANTYEAPYADDTQIDSEVDRRTRQSVVADQPVNVPTWKSHGKVKGCEPIREGVIPSTVLVVNNGADLVKMTFDEAWALNHNSADWDNVWVIGQC